MATSFPKTARRGDSNGHMTVQEMLWFLRDAFDTYVAKGATGNSTVPSGQTTLLVSGSFPANYRVAAAPLNDPGGRWWVSNKTSIQFQLNLQVVAPIGGVAFDWIAKGV